MKKAKGKGEALKYTSTQSIKLSRVRLIKASYYMRDVLSDTAVHGALLLYIKIKKKLTQRVSGEMKGYETERGRKKCCIYLLFKM